MTNSLAADFFHWYFVIFPVSILEAGKNFLIWAWRYFSIGFFALRLFSPWHKDITSYGRGFNLQTWLHAVGWNLISRVIGALLRVLFIIAGLLAEVLILAVCAMIFAGWYLLPILVVVLLTT